MKKILFLMLVLAVMILPAAEHPVAADGKAKMVIVFQPSVNPKAERWDHIYKSHNTPEFGAKYLADYLKEITGADFRRIPEKQWDGRTPAFFVGPTAFARKHGIDFSRFKTEEWLYKSVGKHIVLGGGVNFGQIIAINKLLEKELGCAFLAVDARYFPVRKTLTLPQLNRRGEPSYSLRSIYTLIPYEKSLARKLMLFQRFNRGSIHGRDAELNCRQYHPSHTLYHYVNPDVYFKTHPEYFSMNQKGERFCGSTKKRAGGQICFSNPETAKIAEAQLRKFIAADRKNTPKEKWPVIYAISQLDAMNFLCYCPECKKITEREGGDSGLQLYFINKIARNIAKDYPEIVIQTYAYVSTETAPKHIKPEKNVRIQWIDLYTRSDCFRPITHPVNKKQLAILQGWFQRGIPILYIWDYWNMGGRWNFPPRIETMAPAIKSDLEYYYSIGVRQFFTEAEHHYYDVDFNFYDLQLYLGLQLLDDLSQNEQELIGRFMRLYYGPAEKFMYQAYQKIAEGVATVPAAMTAVNRQRPYQNAAFVKTVYGLMKQAQQSVPENSPFRFRVERELLPVLRTMVYYSNLRGGKSRDEVLNEYKKLRFRQLDYLYAPEEVKKVKPLVEKEIEKISFDFATPEPFKNLKGNEIHKFSALEFRNGMVSDPESKLKNVIRVGNCLDWKKTREKHAAPDLDTQYGKTIFGVTDITGKQTKRIDVGEEIPQDEKYHWYCIRDCKIGPSTVFWGWGWHTRCDLGKVYMDGHDNRYDVWFSLKIVGPSYVRNSRKSDDFFVECVILTKPGAVKTAGH